MFSFGGGGGPAPPQPIPQPANPPMLGSQAMKPRGSSAIDTQAGFGGTILGSDAGLQVSGKTLLGQ